MKITPEELEAQTEGLIKMCSLNTPAQIGIIVVFVDHLSSTLCLRATKINKEKVIEVLKNALKGYGDQEVKEIV